LEDWDEQLILPPKFEEYIENKNGEKPQAKDAGDNKE